MTQKEMTTLRLSLENKIRRQRVVIGELTDKLKAAEAELRVAYAGSLNCRNVIDYALEGRDMKRQPITPHALAQAGEDSPTQDIPTLETHDCSDSTLLRAAIYNAHTKELHITFRTTGATYRFDDIPLELWQDLGRSTSKGTFFIRRIRNCGFGGVPVE